MPIINFLSSKRFSSTGQCLYSLRRSDADDALETALRILEALQKARDAQMIAEEAVSKAQGQITDIETSLDNVRQSAFVFFASAPVKAKDEICNLVVMSVFLFFCLSVIIHAPRHHMLLLARAKRMQSFPVTEI